ncbi:hypothetical protein [Rhodanobacter koreensis]
MKKHILVFALVGTLVAAPGFATAQTMDPNMPGMGGMHHDTKPADAQGTGIIKAIDAGKGTITLQHEAITSIDCDCCAACASRATRRATHA